MILNNFPLFIYHLYILFDEGFIQIFPILTLCLFYYWIVGIIYLFITKLQGNLLAHLDLKKKVIDLQG